MTAGASIINLGGEPITVTRFGTSLQTQILLFDADFVTGNKINLDVDGTPIAEVNFITDQATTLAAVAAAIQATPNVASASVSAAREITIVAEDPGTELFVSGILVTGGATQAGGNITSSAGGYVDGVYQAGAETQFSDIMSIQPINGEELEILPEGERTRRFVKGYIETELRTANEANSQRADRVTRADGEIFEVHDVEKWVDGLSHFKVLMAELNE